MALYAPNRDNLRVERAELTPDLLISHTKDWSLNTVNCCSLVNILLATQFSSVVLEIIINLKRTTFDFYNKFYLKKLVIVAILIN